MTEECGMLTIFEGKMTRTNTDETFYNDVNDSFNYYDLF
jgi:hypothetical protein